MYYFYMILIRCRLTNVCYLIFLTDTWMTIRPQTGRGSRGPTRLKSLALRRAAGEKTRVDIDVNTGVAFGPKVYEFMR